MYLYLVAQLPELVVNVKLLGLRFLSWALELYEKWATTRYPEDSIRVPSVAQHAELGALDPEVFPHQVNGVLLNLRLQSPHGNLCLSRHGAQTPFTNRPDHSPQSSQSPGLPTGILAACWQMRETSLSTASWTISAA